MLFDAIGWVVVGLVLGGVQLWMQRGAERLPALAVGALAAVAGGALTLFSGGRPWHLGSYDVGSSLCAALSGGVALLLLTATRQPAASTSAR
jgi:hypothetical protein